METLHISHIDKSYLVDRERVAVLDDINLEIRAGEFLVIVGHSGCGKSTLLKLIAGLEQPDRGTITIDGREVKGPDHDRAMIFQEHRLFPWMKVGKNVAFGIQDRPKQEQEKLVDRYLSLVRLDDFKNAYPAQLSGGMSQRAAIARALITEPEILLLDEPFGALDAFTKMELQDELLKIRRTCKNTMIMVTHDIEEAVYLADRILVMSAKPGRIREIISVELGEKRNRSSENFTYYKNMIYRFFTEDTIRRPEYFI